MITNSLGYMRVSKASGKETSAGQTYGVVPHCFHRTLDHLRETAIHYLGFCAGWGVGKLGKLRVGTSLQKASSIYTKKNRDMRILEEERIVPN